MAVTGGVGSPWLLKNKGRVVGGLHMWRLHDFLRESRQRKIDGKDQTCKEQKCWGLKYNEFLSRN